jgi:hypothetical protein
MSVFESLPICGLIKSLTNDATNTDDHPPSSFDLLKVELERKNEQGDSVHRLNMKEESGLCIVYNDESSSTELENSCRSIILNKKELTPIGYQFNRILHNEEAESFLQGKDWSKVVVQPCYEGTVLLVYNHQDEWHVSTRRCLDANQSKWVKNKSYREMFDEAVGKKFSFDQLNKDMCYHFILVHHKNRNIISYTEEFGVEYKELIHVFTNEKNTLNEVVGETLHGALVLVQEDFNSLEDLKNKLQNISKENEYQNKITTEGYMLKVYTGEVYKSSFTVLNLQTEIYQKIMSVKPNNSNIHQSYLELYQKDQLNDFIPFFTKYNGESINRIHTSMKNMAKEILDLYHSTRQKKNPALYNSLTDQYKKILYSLHGVYISYRRQDYKSQETMKSELEVDSNGGDNTNEVVRTVVECDKVEDDGDNSSREENEQIASTTEQKSINVHDIYNFIKDMPPNDLRKLYYERTMLLTNLHNTFLNRTCICTTTQSTLMFSSQESNEDIINSYTTNRSRNGEHNKSKRGGFKFNQNQRSSFNKSNKNQYK